MHMTEIKNPLVTLALFSYNQEPFIEEAIEGALSQTYSPLEIILSDDCSSDATFEIMCSMAANYDGPHRVVTNRNSTNLGIAGHINYVMEISEGELIVGAAGDDISLPERTATLASVWEKHGRPLASLYSSYEVVDDSGALIGLEKFESEHQKNDSLNRIDGKQLVVGPSHAWSRILFERFGDIEFDAVNEDVVIQFRASLLGGIIVVPETLIKYRLHGKNITKIGANYIDHSLLERRARVALVYYRRDLSCLKNFRKDIAILENETGSINVEQSDKLKRNIARCELKLEYSHSTVFNRLRCIYVAVKERYGYREFARMVFWLFMPRLS